MPLLLYDCRRNRPSVSGAVPSALLSILGQITYTRSPASIRLRACTNICPMVRASFSCTITDVTGLRPPGSSVSHEMSRFPNHVIAAERGIGVAVITRRCGMISESRLSCSLCPTPKQCCSSITSRARFGAWKVDENAACVATVIQGTPLAGTDRARLRSARRMPPVSSTTGILIPALPSIALIF